MNENTNKNSELNEQELETAAGGASITFRLQCPNCGCVKLISDPSALASSERCECGALMRGSAMSELNEKDLEQVVGGGENEGSTIAWRKKNCDVCASACDVFTKTKMITKVIEYRERGEEWVCPNKQ